MERRRIFRRCQRSVGSKSAAAAAANRDQVRPGMDRTPDDSNRASTLAGGETSEALSLELVLEIRGWRKELEEALEKPWEVAETWAGAEAEMEVEMEEVETES